MNFAIPPRIEDGKFGIGDESASSDLVEWNHLEQGLENDDGMITTSVGKLEVGGHNVRLVIGYRAEDRLPFMSWTVFAPAGENSWCNFNFAEVRK